MTEVNQLLNAIDQGSQDDEVLVLDEPLAELEQHDRQAAQLVQVHYLSGLPHQEAAATLGSRRRV